MRRSARCCRSWRAPQVLVGFAPEGGEAMLRPARKPLTLRHLLTHTSGFSYDMWNPEIGAYMAARAASPASSAASAPR